MRNPRDRNPLTQQQRAKQAIRDSTAAQSDQNKRRIKRPMGVRRVFWSDVSSWIGKMLKLALVVAIIMIADGVRRESGEFSTKVVYQTGRVQVHRSNITGWMPATDNTGIVDGDSVTTDTDSTATLAFHDGSGMLVDPSSELVVRMLDYTRNGARDRSFKVGYGSVLVRTSYRYGLFSKLNVCSPSAVAVTNGAHFRFWYNSRTGETTVQVYSGSVDLICGQSVARIMPGREATAVSYSVSRPKLASASNIRLAAGQLGALASLESQQGSLEETEYKLTALSDPVIQVLGLAPGGWDYNATNFFRRNACRESLMKLQVAMESNSSRQMPSYLSLATLAELQMSKEETAEILSGFSGMMLQSYARSGFDRFTIYARARDKKRTLFQLTDTSITLLNGQ